MMEKHHVYIVDNGRMSMCGLTESNVAYVAAAMKDAIETCKWLLAWLPLFMFSINERSGYFLIV